MRSSASDEFVNSVLFFALIMGILSYLLVILHSFLSWFSFFLSSIPSAFLFFQCCLSLSVSSLPFNFVCLRFPFLPVSLLFYLPFFLFSLLRYICSSCCLFRLSFPVHSFASFSLSFCFSASVVFLRRAVNCLCHCYFSRLHTAL